VKDLYRTAPEISPEHHVRMQAVVQQHVENAVSKTVNLPENATPDDIGRIYLLARELRCKGITVYRYNSKPDQVLSRGCETCRADV
jgi:ribonucleoside-diphosphate reductase alpha chain